MRDGNNNQPLDEGMGLFHVSTLKGTPPQREWAVDQYIPKRSVTGLFGSGGIGKSLIAQQLGTSISLGLDWLGLATKQSSVLGYFCEDDYDELWRRQEQINKSINCESEHLGEFHLQSRVGLPNIMMEFVNGIGKPTKFFEQIKNDIKVTASQFLMLDNAAQLFGGNENDRREVTQFVNALHSLIHGGDLTILLLGHPPKQSGIGNAHDYSGSTAWDACFRSRLFFGKQEGEKEEDNLEHRVLSKRKANYSSVGDYVTVEWKHGVFFPVKTSIDLVDKIEVNVKQKSAKEEFLKRLDILNKRNQFVSHSSNSPNFAPKIMMAMGNVPDAINKKLFEKAMMLLLNEGKIIANVEVSNKNSRKVFGLRIVDE